MNVSNTFYNSIWVVYTVWHNFTLMLTKKLSWNIFEMSNQSNQIWLKWLNSHNYKVRRLN